MAATVIGLIGSTFVLMALVLPNSGITAMDKGYAFAVLIMICAYISGFGLSWGPLGWVVTSEIFPLEIRSAAQSITVAVNLFMTFFIAQIFMAMLCHFKSGIFFFFAAWVVVMTGKTDFLFSAFSGQLLLKGFLGRKQSKEIHEIGSAFQSFKAANSTFGLIFQSAKVYDDKPVFLFIVSSLSPAGLPYSSRKRMERTPTPIRIPFNSIRDRSDRQRRET
ncbi:Sugar transport protein MST3 [Sesamum angolense]|uniref:Sugar transport protein MST3 n=1 Tax=Sesamum angolense TaxID=2727404 RepID=A0AAE1VZL3_9LAMI|nr:Sugar transport protein MST3 [Sesamum angolense]